jgi:hypothetical protein
MGCHFAIYRKAQKEGFFLQKQAKNPVGTRKKKEEEATPADEAIKR